MCSLRVFVSYSHSESAIAGRIVQALRDNGLDPIWDQDFCVGMPVWEQVRTAIAHAHVFLPLLTPEPSKCAWVHQEIGCASALNVPVVPVVLSTGELPPRGIVEAILGIRLDPQAPDLRAAFPRAQLEAVVEQAVRDRPPLYECASDSRARAVLMAGYANAAVSMQRLGTVRQKGGLSSFHIPDALPDDPVWEASYHGTTRELSYYRCLRDERLALMAHAAAEGCRLIVDISYPFRRYGPTGRQSRLRVLRAFLEGIADDRCQIVTHRGVGRRNVTLVGDLFLAQAAYSRFGTGYQQTIFTRHAPTVRAQISEFDEEFSGLLAALDWRPEQSRHKVIDLITAELDNIGAGPLPAG